MVTPQAGISNAARGNDQRRTRELQSPQAGIFNAKRFLIISNLGNKNFNKS